MNKLFLFFSRNRVLFAFILLEICSFWLVVNKNSYQNASFFLVSIEWSGRVENVKNSILQTLSLKDQNEKLMTENARLKESLQNLQPKMGIRSDLPPEVLNRYYYVPAEVINQTTERMSNYLTLNKGRKDGISENMGIISSSGVVGKVINASSNFSLGLSILNPSFYIASKLSRTGIQGSAKWDGQNIYKSKLLYVPMNLDVRVGDSIVTSGFNSVFPAGVPVGIVSDVNVQEGDAFLDITFILFHDFKKTSAVYSVGDRLKVEKDTLEQIIVAEQ